MKKRINRIIIVCLILFIGLTIIIVRKDFLRFNKNKDNSTNENNRNIIVEIQNSINSNADTNMYQIEEEYDGRQTIQIKNDIQYDTVLAGILKKGIPAENEVDKILKDKPNNNGIWISKQARDKFKNLLVDNNLENFAIDDDGYLYQISYNDGIFSKKLEGIIKSSRKYILDFSGTCYVRDDLSGQVVEYPFERMDPNQVLEIYKKENETILEITTNAKGKITNKKILETILLNME